MSDTQYWNHDVTLESCLPLDLAIEAAREYLEEHALDCVTLAETREPTPDDLRDYTEGVVDRVSEWLREDEPLVHDSGGPELPPEPQPGPELDALRAALRAYVSAYVEMSEASWVPTGRLLIVHSDGRVEEEVSYAG